MKSINTVSTHHQVAKILFDIGCVIFRPRQPFKYDSGILSPVYTDNRLVISYPDKWKKIIEFLITKINEIGLPDVVAGTATAGIPHAAYIAQQLKIPMVYVRAEPKSHGKGNQVEGRIIRGQKVIIIEDLVSTGRSSTRVAEAIKKLGANVSSVVAIYTYQLKESEDNFKKSNIKLHALTNLKTSCEVAREEGFLKEDQIEIILDWAKDPENWAKKMGYE